MAINNKQKQIRYIFFAVFNVSFILITFYAFFWHACLFIIRNQNLLYVRTFPWRTKIIIDEMDDSFHDSRGFLDDSSF